MTNNAPSAYFERAKALQKMILEAGEDLKQLRIDALEELGVDKMAKEEAKEIRKDLAEVFAVAKIEVKGEIERRNQAAKMARRKRIAEECGVQLDLLGDEPAAPARRMAKAAGKADVAIDKAAKKLFDRKDGVKVELRDGEGRLIARGDGAGNISIEEKAEPEPGGEPRIFGVDHCSHGTDEVPDGYEDESPPPATSAASEPSYGAPISAADSAALTDIPSFLRRC